MIHQLHAHNENNYSTIHPLQTKEIYEHYYRYGQVFTIGENGGKDHVTFIIIIDF